MCTMDIRMVVTPFFCQYVRALFQVSRRSWHTTHHCRCRMFGALRNLIKALSCSLFAYSCTWEEPGKQRYQPRLIVHFLNGSTTGSAWLTTISKKRTSKGLYATACRQTSRCLYDCLCSIFLRSRFHLVYS